jgi:hypothetical protein
VCALGLVPVTTSVSAGESGALTPAERRLLQDPQAARQEILRRVQNVESALVSMSGDTGARVRLAALERELGKVQRALEAQDYKAAYTFARRVEGWATGGLRTEQ